MLVITTMVVVVVMTAVMMVVGAIYGGNGCGGFGGYQLAITFWVMRGDIAILLVQQIRWDHTSTSR